MTASPYPREVPPLWLLGALLGAVALHTWLPGATVIAPPWTWAGWGLAVVAVLVMVTSAVLFRAAGTGIVPFRPATALVARGPFRWTRNPMYLGMTAIVLGTAIGLGSLTPFALAPALWFVLDRRFVRAEERFLRAAFGAPYDDYCARVRRWL